MSEGSNKVIKRSALAVLTSEHLSKKNLFARRKNENIPSSSNCGFFGVKEMKSWAAKSIHKWMHKSEFLEVVFSHHCALAQGMAMWVSRSANHFGPH